MKKQSENHHLVNRSGEFAPFGTKTGDKYFPRLSIADDRGVLSVIVGVITIDEYFIMCT